MIIYDELFIIRLLVEFVLASDFINFFWYYSQIDRGYTPTAKGKGQAKKK
jgi:hypothetical protein